MYPLLPLFKASLGRQLSYTSELGLVIRLVAFPSVALYSLQPSFHIEFSGQIVCTGGDVCRSAVVQVGNEHEMYSFLLLLRFSQPVSAPKRRTSLGSDGVFAHGTVVKRREGSPAAEKEL